ncbi:MAG: response regulator, partial [Chitinophagaceae bacterium]
NKSIPFLFFTGAVSPEIVNEAYCLEVQGFYRKGSNYAALKRQIHIICTYWEGCLHPNKTID